MIARLRDTLGLFTELRRGYGDIVRYRILFWEFCIVFDPELIREVVDEQRSSFEKGFIYKRNTVLHGPTIVTGDGQDHKRRRRIIQPFFHREALAGYAETMAQRAVVKREEWRHGRIIDADAEMRDLTLSISLNIFFEDGMQIDVKMARDLVALLTLDFQLALLPGRALIKRALPRYRRLLRRKAPMDEIIVASIRAARAAPAGSRTDLTAFLACAGDEQGGPAFSEDEVLDEVIEMLMASHETTGGTLAWAFYFLSRNPAARERMEREVDAVLEGRPATLKDYDRLVLHPRRARRDAAPRRAGLLHRPTGGRRPAPSGATPFPPAPTCNSAVTFLTGTRGISHSPTGSSRSAGRPRSRSVRSTPICPSAPARAAASARRSPG